MKSNRTQLIISGAAIVLGFAAIFGLGNFLEKALVPFPEDFDDGDLAINGSRLKGFALGMEGLIADWYWVRSLQYIGDKMIKSGSDFQNIDDLSVLNPRLLYPYLETATDLDPHFIAAYSYGAIVLPAIDPTKAIAITEKGIANNPNEWRLYQHLGYIYWRIGNYEKAAATYEKGSEIADAAPFMKMMAASMLTEGGSRDTSRKIFQRMLDDSDEQNIRLTMTLHLNEIDSLDERAAIDAALADFRQKTGRCASSLNEIFPMLRGIRLPGERDFRIDAANRLVDPTDAPYLLDKENCRAALDLEHTKLPRK